ncbi:unnamed protein product, partial [marine sediment metagenome]
EFADDGADYEDISIVLGNDNNTISLATDTLATIFDFGVIDQLAGVETIDFDAEAGDITLTADLAGEDLTVQQAGSVNASLVLYSAGTSTDSVKIYSAKGIDIDSVDDMAITNTATTDADDMVIAQVGASDASLLLTSGGTGLDALGLSTTHSGGDIKISSGDMIDIDAVDDIYIDISGSGENLDVDVASGSIHLDAGEADAQAIWLAATAGGIDIDTAATFDVDIDAVGGKFLVTASENAAGSMNLIANGGSSETFLISCVKGTGAGSIDIDSTVGGITIAANATGKDVDIDSVLGSIYIEAEENDANAILITSDGGTSSGLCLHNDTGTSVTENHASIQLLSDAGGIAIESDANLATSIVLLADGGDASTMLIHNDQGTGTTEDSVAIQIQCDEGGIAIQSDANLANSIVLLADGGDSETIVIHSDQGTGASSITIVSDEGGINIDGGTGGDIDITSTGKSVHITATESAA